MLSSQRPVLCFSGKTALVRSVPEEVQRNGHLDSPSSDAHGGAAVQVQGVYQDFQPALQLASPSLDAHGGTAAQVQGVYQDSMLIMLIKFLTGNGPSGKLQIASGPCSSCSASSIT